VPTNPSGDVVLKPLGHPAHTLQEWLCTFHLAAVILDPYTYESAWILETAGRILGNFDEADCRVAFVVTASEDQATQFVGPWKEEILCFADPDRGLARGLDLQALPAFVHIAHDLQVVALAEGWNPAEWREVADNLAKMMAWTEPLIPAQGDPAPFAGTPALG